MTSFLLPPSVRSRMFTRLGVKNILTKTGAKAYPGRIVTRLCCATKRRLEAENGSTKSLAFLTWLMLLGGVLLFLSIIELILN